MVRQLGTDDIPAEGGIIGRPAAGRTPKRKDGAMDGRRRLASTYPAARLCSGRIPATRLSDK